MLKASFRVLTDIKKIVDTEALRTRKALSMATTVTAHGLRFAAKKALQVGELSLKEKSSYRNELGDRRYKKSRSKKATLPFVGRGMATGVLSDVNYRNFVAGTAKHLSAEVGFIGSTPGTQWQAKIAKKSIPGYMWLIKPRHKEALHAMGIHLRKATTSAKVPARDIMDAVMEKYPEHIILQRINTLFDQKMKGGHIQSATWANPGI